MEKMVINGVEFCNFGSNDYTNGMELITAYPMPKNMIQDVLDGKYPGVFLNPSIPCSDEFYGFFGTKSQYKLTYKEQVNSQIAKQLVNKFGWGKWPKEADAYQEELEKNYKDWWDSQT